MAKSDYLETNLLNHVLRNTSYTSPTAVYLGLYTAAPTDAGGGTEVAGGSYARQAVSFGAPSGGQVANDAVINFPMATGDWGVILHIGIFDAASSGNLLYHAPMTASREILTNDQLDFPVGQLIVTED